MLASSCARDNTGVPVVSFKVKHSGIIFRGQSDILLLAVSYIEAIVVTSLRFAVLARLYSIVKAELCRTII